MSMTPFLFNIENLVLEARSEFNDFAGTTGDVFWSTGILEYWSVGKKKAHISLQLVLSLLHYSTTPSLQQTAASWKECGGHLRGLCKAKTFGSGFFTYGPGDFCFG